jgi:hypothetical protein
VGVEEHLHMSVDEDDEEGLHQRHQLLVLQIRTARLPFARITTY